MRTPTAVVLCVLLAVSPATAATSPPQTEPPLADAGLDQTVQQGATVHLDATGSRDPDGDITSYEWTIETPGGTTTTPDCAACARTTFVAERTGTYSVTVAVTDNEGASRSDTLYVTVEPSPEGPTVSLSGPTRPAVGSEGRYTASFTAGDAAVETLVWQVDGERVSKHDARADTALDRTFETATTRTIAVTAYDENGRKATDELTVRPQGASDTRHPQLPTTPEATDPPGEDRSTESTEPSGAAGTASAPPRTTPSLSVDGPTTVFADESYAYTATTENVPTSAAISWAAGDEGSRVTRSWDTTGTYTVAASTAAHGTEVGDSLTVEVIDPSIEIVGPTEVKTGIFASFSARTSGVPDDATLRWDNGETGDTTGRKWSEPGTYTIEVATTVAGRVISDTHTVSVTELVIEDPNEPPKVDIDDPGSLTAGEDVALTATYSDPDGRVVDVEWDPAQTVTVPGPSDNLVVSVTVTDDDGAEAADDVTLHTHELGKESQGTVKCYYENPYEKVRNAPSGGCEASWGESWTQKDISTNWQGTVGQYDVTWVKVENRDNSEATTTATDDPVEHCMGCNNLRDDNSGSNPTQQQSGSTSTTTADTGSYTKNGKAVHNDLTGDGVVNVIDWNRRFDNGYVDGPGGGNDAFGGAGPGLALRGANGQQVGAGATSSAGSWTDDIVAPGSNGGNGGDGTGDSNHGGSPERDGVPGQENADPGGTNGRVDTEADGTRSEDQSVRDYKEEFTARLDLNI